MVNQSNGAVSLVIPFVNSFRVKRDDDEGPGLLEEKFPEPALMLCEYAWKTEEVPFTVIVLLKDSGRLLCMGSIVDSRHVLTAKRCYEKCDAADLLVLAGYYKAYWGRDSQVKKVKRIIRHEFEVTLLRLSSPLTFTDYVQPARFPNSGSKIMKFSDGYSDPFQVVGFFVDRFDVPGDYISKELFYNVKEDSSVTFDDCKTNYTKMNLDEDKMFCILGNATYCWGGWGGPVIKMMETDNPFYLQIGVVVADNCTTDTTGPLLAARTDSYWDWIRGNSFRGHQPS
ncbi:hypothetical protein RUM43_014114 [Polyplax serrata]|uniref:Peptidase S1 domain-containing protein n=1 Tax=Polyplax serrata TaxID=468196 RepID=A0AAN8P0D0_POLSC